MRNLSSIVALVAAFAGLGASSAGEPTVVLALSRGSLGGASGTQQIDVTVTYAGFPGSVRVVAELLANADRDTLWNLVDGTPDGVFTRSWSGSASGGTTIPNGHYVFAVTVEDETSGTPAASDSLPVTVDRAAPVIQEYFVTGPDGAYRNGEFIPLRARFDEDPATIEIRAAADTGTPDAPVVSPAGDHVFDILYRISPDNPHPDARGLAVVLSVADSIGNRSESQDVSICLSNGPPLLYDSAVLDEAGNELPLDTTFGPGQTVRTMAIFETAQDSVTVDFPFTYTADFGDVDTEFSLSNPARRDTVFRADLPDSLLTPGYRSFARVEFSYTLSEDNGRPEGRREAIIRAADTGCGEAFSDSVFVTLDRLRPPPPILRAPEVETTTEATATLTGTAAGAAKVVVTRASDSARSEAVVDTTDASFAVVVPLDPGRNTFTAIARDRAAHPSHVSNEVAIYRTPEGRLEIPSRFRPGDIIRATALENASRIDLDVFDLSAVRVWHESVPEPGSLHEFAWDGRNENGDRVLSGPYIARVTWFTAGGKRTLNQAFVFTRK